MISLCLGAVGFVLYLLYDINSFTRQNPLIHSFFHRLVAGCRRSRLLCSFDLLFIFRFTL